MSDQSPKGIKDYVRMDKLDIPLVITIVAVFIVAMATLIPYLPTVGYWPEDFAELTEIIRNWALMFVGAFALWLAWRRIALMDAQTAIAQSDHVAARYENAVSLLESEHEMSRVAGVNTLRDLGLKYKNEYLQQATNLIAAFVRSNRAAGHCGPSPSPDVEEAFKTIGQFLATAREGGFAEMNPPLEVDLRKVSFAGVKVQRWDFQNVGCDGAVLKKASFADCRVRGDSIQNMPEFDGTRFSDCEFSGEFFLGSFVDCSFGGCEFSGVMFDGGDFSNSKFFKSRKINRKLRIPLASPAYRQIFKRCNLNNTAIEVSDGIEKSSFLPEDFAQCSITDPEMAPKPMSGNDPVLHPVVSPELDRHGFHYVGFREAGDDE